MFENSYLSWLDWVVIWSYFINLLSFSIFKCAQKFSYTKKPCVYWKTNICFISLFEWQSLAFQLRTDIVTKDRENKTGFFLHSPLVFQLTMAESVWHLSIPAGGSRWSSSLQCQLSKFTHPDREVSGLIPAIQKMVFPT